MRTTEVKLKKKILMNVTVMIYCERTLKVICTFRVTANNEGKNRLTCKMSRLPMNTVRLQIRSNLDFEFVNIFFTFSEDESSLEE